MDIRDNDGWTVLMWANRSTEIKTLIKNHIQKMISLVIEKGRTKNGIPLMSHSHKDIYYCVASYVN